MYVIKGKKSSRGILNNCFFMRQTEYNKFAKPGKKSRKQNGMLLSKK